MKEKKNLKNILHSKMFTLILLLALIVIIFTAISGGGYLRPRNIVNIFNSMTVVAFLTIGAGCLIISGQMDLSTGAVGTLSAIIYAMATTTWGLPWFVALIIALVCAAVFGLLNAVLINELNFQGFITTLATTSVASGCALVVTSAKAVKVTDPVMTFVGSQKLFGILPVSVLIAIVFFVVYGIILAKTSFGRSLYLIGGNPNAARIAGLQPKRMSYILFINSSVMGGISGIILAGRIKSATTGGITNSQFAGITAAILGGVSFGGGSGGMLGAFMGLLVLNAFNNGISTIEGLDPYWQTVASGALLLIALAFDFFRERRKLSSKGGI